MIKHTKILIQIGLINLIILLTLKISNAQQKKLCGAMEYQQLLESQNPNIQTVKQNIENGILYYYKNKSLQKS